MADRPQKRTIKIISKELVATNTIRAVFDLGEKVDFDAGQFVDILVERGVKRSYSISNIGPSNEIETYVDVSPGGKGSMFYVNSKVGDEIESIFPLGRFIYEPKTTPVYFVSTGSGIVPMKAMILKELEKTKSNRKMILLFGVRTMENLFLEEFFDKLAEKYPNFSVYYCLSKEEFENTYFGRVTSLLSELEIERDADMYICGNSEMITDVEHLALNKGICKENIYFERYF